MLNKLDLAKELVKLGEVYDKKISELLIAIYYDALKHYRIEQIQSATNYIIQTNVYNCFPKPAEFILAIDGSPEDRAQQAWNTVLHAIKSIGNYKTVEFEDPVIHQTINEMGGWQRIAVHKKDETTWIEKSFIAHYTLIQKRNQPDKPALRGYFDIKNNEQSKPKLVECKYLPQSNGRTQLDERRDKTTGRAAIN